MNIQTQKILAYSLDKKLTPAQIRKADDFSDFFSDARNQASLENLKSRMDKHNIIGLLDDGQKFPHQLRSIQNPPSIIYAMGNLDILKNQILGIVGPRDMSEYANQVMQALFTQISDSNIVTVSGMARGVDHLCHQLSMAYHLPTIAILGGGIRHYRNSSARSFMQQIIQNGGLILSEFKLDFQPTARSFPQRNRLIAGLSDALFLPEARKGSGSLITADFAHRQHKPILVVPNLIFSENGIGSNHLVTTGKANLLSDFSQILKLFGIYKESNKSEKLNSLDVSQLTEEEKSLLKIISQHRDEDFSTRMGEISVDFGDAMVKMTDLEIQGYVIQNVPGIYSVNVTFI